MLALLGVTRLMAYDASNELITHTRGRRAELKFVKKV